MANISLYYHNTGETISVNDADLDHTTNTELIEAAIKERVFCNPYCNSDDLWFIILPKEGSWVDVIKTLSKLGYVDGDTATVIIPVWENSYPISKEVFYSYWRNESNRHS